MKLIREGVDDRDGGVGGHFLEDFLLYTRATIPWTQRSRLRATSAMDSRAPSEAEACVWSRKTTEPPMLWMPTSKVTRVRSEGFSKMSAMNLPVRLDA